MSKKVLSIHTGDVHLTDKKPLARVDESDWYEAQFRVIRWLGNLAEEYSHADVIIGGDLFDSPQVSYHLLNRFFFEFQKCRNVIALIGNHEQPNKNSVGLSASVFETGTHMGLYQGVLFPTCLSLRGVKYGFIPATNSEEQFKEYTEEVQDADVIVLHKFVWASEENSHIGASVSGNVSSIAKLFPNAKVLFASDNHKGFECTTINPRIYNCGMLIRDNADLVNYQPRVYVLYDDFSVDRVDVPIENDIITDRHIKSEKERVNAEEVFFRTLSDSKDISYSFSDNLKRYAKDHIAGQYLLDKYSVIKGKELTWEMI
jgi:DNA repair exonuclease SbcCD nuclease subunit